MPESGLRGNWRQYTFVGAMLSLERAVVPLIVSQEFGIASVSATPRMSD